MKVTKGIIRSFILLADGNNVPASKMRSFKEIDEMVADGVLTTITHGSRQTYRCTDKKLFVDYLASKYQIYDLEKALEILEDNEASRSTQVQLTGDSKFVRRRVMKGFLVNTYEPLTATLNGEPITLSPPEGSYIFIYDYEQFAVPADTLIIGIENSENFRRIKWQKWLFDSLYPGRHLLFVSRYPQNGSHDLVKWLTTITNDYVHFGDLDLAGIRIFLTEFQRYLGPRASFLIPTDYDERIISGSRERYDLQLPTIKSLDTDDPCLQELIDCIHRHHRGYDQEGFCVKPQDE